MKTLLATLLVLVSLSASAQTKDTFELRSFPTYDEFGNYYAVINRYDHIPTTQDSLTFKIESEKAIDKMIEENKVKYQITPAPVKKKSKKRKS